MNFSLAPQPHTIATAIAKRLRVLRKQHRWSQAELARRSGVSLGSLKRFEQQGKISLGNLLALAHVFHRLGDFDRVFWVDEDYGAARRRFEALDR